jgi:hypothetical protein
MILPASYSNGFAPRDGQPLYPELWRRNIFSVSASLGQTGSTLREWGPSCNNFTLINDPAWGPKAGHNAITFDGTNELLKGSVISSGNVGTKNATIVIWCVLPDASVFGGLINKRHNGGVFQQWSVCQGHINSSFAAVPAKYVSLFWYAGGAITDSQHVYTSADVADGRLHCLVFRRINGTTPQIWVDGVNRAVTVVGTATANANADSSTDPIRIGALTDAGASLAYSFIEARMYETALSDAAIRLVSSRPGVSHELAPRRRSSSAVQFNRRRRLLLGAQS